MWAMNVQLYVHVSTLKLGWIVICLYMIDVPLTEVVQSYHGLYSASVKIGQTWEGMLSWA